MSEVVWQDPPEIVRSAGHRRPSIWQQKLGPLVEHPGRWALVHQGSNHVYSTVIRYQITHGRMRVPEGTSAEDWEFTSRKTADGTYDTYGRFIGGA